MGKAKQPVKKTTSSMKISKSGTATIQRKSKNSQSTGKETTSTSSKKAKSISAPSKGGKEGKKMTMTAKSPPKSIKKADQSNPKKKPPPMKASKSSSSPPAKKGEKVQTSTKSTAKGGKATQKPKSTKVTATKKKVISKKIISSSSSSSSTTLSSASSSASLASSDGDRSTRSRGSTGGGGGKKKNVSSRHLRHSKDDQSQLATRLRKQEASDKVSTRKRSKSDSESPPPQKMAKKGKVVKVPPPGKKKVTKVAPNKVVVAKKVTKKAASLVASKKKTVVKKVVKSNSNSKTGSSASSSTSSRRSSPSPQPMVSKTKTKEPKSSKSSSSSQKLKQLKGVKVGKGKTKPKTKVKAKRMASLNAKAILEASFSFEPSDKKQRSPAPNSSSSSATGLASAPSTPRGKSVSVSVGTSSTDELLLTSSSKSGASHDASPTLTTPLIKSESKAKEVGISVSVSTSTSPTPPEMPSSSSPPPQSQSPKTFKARPIPIKGESKRKSSTSTSTSAPSSRRESTSSISKSSGTGIGTDNHISAFAQFAPPTDAQHQGPLTLAKKEKSSGKASSRRSSVVSVSSGSDPPPQPQQSQTKGSPKKKQKAGMKQMSTTSTSTSTSPIPQQWQQAHDDRNHNHHHHHNVTESNSHSQTVPKSMAPSNSQQAKQKKQRTSSTSAREKAQDFGSQAQSDLHHHHHHHHHSTSSSKPSKEKPGTPVAIYGSSGSSSSSGTVYQPAGPLIEPHKQTSVPAGILPESVRLPPDLKVTYQTHPPSSSSSSSSVPKTSTKSSKSHKLSSSSSAATTKTHHKSSSNEKTSVSGTILHQPYKSASPSSASAYTRNIPSTYSSTGSGYASSTETPLLSPDVTQSAHAHISHLHHQTSSSSSSSSSSLHHHNSVTVSSQNVLHSVAPGGSNPNASSGMFCASAAAANYGHGASSHHSPFAPSKYHLVPPEQYSYRTQSPFPNSFLCPPTTPQPPSQSYFMTPFYTPPLTPNPTPVPSAQPRPLSLSSTSAAAGMATSHHHPAYYQHHPAVGPSLAPPPSASAAAAAAAAAAHLPANYYMASPQHHSMHPTPAPGHAGPFRRNPSSPPACPCPTDSYPRSNNCTNINNSSKPQQQLRRPSPSSGSLPVPVGASRGNSTNVPQNTASPLSRTTNKDIRSQSQQPQSYPHPSSLEHQQRPTCTTPAVASDAIQMIPTEVDVAQQARQQLESAKTFTEQYSLPDDITITPILPPTPIQNSATTNALLMLNSSISVILTSAPSSVSTSTTTTTANMTCSKSAPANNHHPEPSLRLNNSCNRNATPNNNHNPNQRPKEKDIVHVIDPRSGQRTTIAKHMSNANSRGGNVKKSPQNLNHSGVPQQKGKHGTGSGSRMEAVRKLNPDLDVIVINSCGGSRSDKIENIQIQQNGTHPSSPMRGGGATPKINGPSSSPIRTMPPLRPGGRVGVGVKQGQSPGNGSQPTVPFSAISSSIMGGKRPTLQYQQNGGNNFQTQPPGSLLRMTQNKQRPRVSKQMSPPTSYTMAMPVLPSGISVSAGGKTGGGGLDLSKTSNYPNAPLDFSAKRRPTQKVTAIKRSLNECIDGLQLQQQQKRLKLMEQTHSTPQSQISGGGRRQWEGSSARTAVYHANGGRSRPMNSAVATNANVNYQFMMRGGEVQQRPQQPHPQQQQFPWRETATAARVRDPDYEVKLGGMHINANDAVNAVSALVVDKQQTSSYSFARGRPATTSLNNSNRPRGRPCITTTTAGPFTFIEKKKVVGRVKGREKVQVKGFNKSSKVRTRLSVKPRSLNGNSQQPLGSRSRSRLLRKRSLLCTPNGGNTRRSESDGSMCPSRSNSSVRIIAGASVPGSSKGSGKDRERERPRHTQAFINATADLYHYRRCVILRVPSPKPGGFSAGEATASLDGTSAFTNLNKAIPFFREMPSSSSEEVEELRTEPSREFAAHQMAQLARTHILGSQSQSQIDHKEHTHAQPPSSTSAPPFNFPRTGSMVVNALKKRAGMKPLSPASVNGALSQQWLLNARRQPRWSNGWTFEGEPYEAKVYIRNDDPPVTRRCYPSMRHDGGDVIRTRDCVLLKSGPRKNDLPFIAKVAALWENPADGEMMFSLLWYYRPEHTELGRTKDDMMDEIFASKHRDTNSVATIEDRCYVLTFNEYCRYRKRLKQLEQGIPDSSFVPFEDTAMVNSNAAAKIAEAVWNGFSQSSSSGKVSPEVVFFCRKVYDFRQKRILKNPS